MTGEKPLVPQDKSLSECPECGWGTIVLADNDTTSTKHPVKEEIPYVVPFSAIPHITELEVYCGNCGQQFIWDLRAGRITVKE